MEQEFDFEKITIQIGIGSAELNRMRQEIELVVKTLLSLVDDRDIHAWLRKTNQLGKLYATKELYAPAPFGKWHIIYNGKECNMIAKCWLRCGGDAEGVEVAYSSRSGDTPFSMFDVQSVCDSRKFLVQGMIETFPRLVRSLEPILNASKNVISL